MITLTFTDQTGRYEFGPPRKIGDRTKALQIKALHESMGDTVKWEETEDE